MSLVETRIQNLRAESNLDKYELRPSRYGAFDTFMKQSEDANGILTPELKAKAEQSIGSVIETPVLDYDADITIGNKRTITIPDSENTSHMQTITFATYAWGFTIVPSLYHNNEIGLQKDFNRKFMKYLYKFAQKLDETALAALSTKKTQVMANKLLYDFTGNSINAEFTQRENVFGDLEVMQAANDFYGSLDIVGDAGVESIIKKLQQLGGNNYINKSNEFAGKSVHFTNNLASATGKYAQGYAVQEGSLGVLLRFERECLRGTKMADGHEWGISELPLLGMPCGTYYYEGVGDETAIAGAASADMDRVVKQHYGFAVDVAFITPYNSDPETIASPIIAFNISSANAKYGVPVVNVE